jgi:hypothetical protein
MKIKIYIFMNAVKAHFLCTNSSYEIESIIQVNFINVRCFHYRCLIIMQTYFCNNADAIMDVYVTELLETSGGFAARF